MENIDKFIGIPHVFAGHSFNGADCVGLVRLFYREHNWKPDCYDGEFTKDWYVKEPYRIIRYLMKYFDKTKDTNELSFGDIVYFVINKEGHVGIYLEYNKILTTFPPNVKLWDGSIMPGKSFIARKNIWMPVFTAGFKRRCI